MPEPGLEFTFGIEEEFFLVDPETRDIIADPDPGIMNAANGKAARIRWCPNCCAPRLRPTRGSALISLTGRTLRPLPPCR